jgi:hypothetical protein
LLSQIPFFTSCFHGKHSFFREACTHISHRLGIISNQGFLQHFPRHPNCGCNSCFLTQGYSKEPYESNRCRLNSHRLLRLAKQSFGNGGLGCQNVFVQDQWFLHLLAVRIPLVSETTLASEMAFSLCAFFLFTLILFQPTRSLGRNIR